ncbi:MAG: hypothetical protein QGI24_06100 [Kiritimatiellia bacterium]|nr:hypothetical protein [Kiritimatiellia bacterium]MDP6848341.1 hypothetical protein [Kiritimatiellia bacterium]
MTSLLHRMTRMLIVLLMLSCGLYVLCMGVSASRWNFFVDVTRAGRSVGIAAGFGVVCLAFLYMLSGYRRGKRRERYLSFDNDGGTVSISTVAISDYVCKLSPEFPSIVSLNVDVIPVRNSVDLLVGVRIRAGSQVHEVCELLQQRVRESMINGLGISQVRRIEVSVREIVSEHKPR